MSEPTVRCAACAGLGRLADAPCQTCGGLGRVAASQPQVVCPDCRGLVAPPVPCERCLDTGSVQACADCTVEPAEAMTWPCCSNACLEKWKAKQRLLELDCPPPIIRRAP